MARSTLLLCASCALLGCGSDGGGPIGDDDIPDIAYCDSVANWDAEWTALESDVLVIVNQRRSEGADCGSEGTFGPAPALQNDGGLHCAARLHSMDMNVRDFWNHTNPDNEEPWDRMDRAGYQWSRAAENIGRRSGTPEGVMLGWMNSDGHCGNIMNPALVHIGIGYYAGSPHWTQVFGAPR